jgi:hypothetical protein
MRAFDKDSTGKELRMSPDTPASLHARLSRNTLDFQRLANSSDKAAARCIKLVPCSFQVRSKRVPCGASSGAVRLQAPAQAFYSCE